MYQRTPQNRFLSLILYRDSIKQNAFLKRSTMKLKLNNLMDFKHLFLIIKILSLSSLDSYAVPISNPVLNGCNILANNNFAIVGSQRCFIHPNLYGNISPPDNNEGQIAGFSNRPLKEKETMDTASYYCNWNRKGDCRKSSGRNR